MCRPQRDELDFLQWLETLSDEEHHLVLERLRLYVAHLGPAIDRDAIDAQALFDLEPHSTSMLSLN
jgi:hypothetical protein